MRSLLAFALYLPLLAIAWLGWVLVDWAGAQNSEVATVAAGAALLAVATWFIKRSWLFVVAPAVVALLLMLCTVVDISPVQPAARAVRRIRAGMSEAEVRAILDSEFPARLRPAGMNRPLERGALSFVLGRGASHNAAVVHVEFVRDRVVTAKFLAD